MDKLESEFDQFADKYESLLKEDLYKFGERTNIFAEYKVKLARELLSKEPESLLEFGCGIGRNFPYFTAYFSNTKVTGCDISELSIDVARNAFHDRTFFISKTIQEFLSYNTRYNVCFIACVLHHVSPVERIDWLRAIKSKLKPEGRIIIFEHNLYNPLVRYIVKKSPIDVHAEFLNKKSLCKLLRKSGYTIEASGYTMLFPVRNSWTEKIEKTLQRFPLGGQYFILAF